MVDENNNELMVQTKMNAANTLRSLALAIENGSVSSYEISQTRDGELTIKADSSDGNKRIIQTQTKMNGYNRTSTEHIQKQTPYARRQTVGKFIKEGMSQTEIAQKTMFSQKTISNDVKKLREDGEL